MPDLVSQDDPGIPTPVPPEHPEPAKPGKGAFGARPFQSDTREPVCVYHGPRVDRRRHRSLRPIPPPGAQRLGNLLSHQDAASYRSRSVAAGSLSALFDLPCPWQGRRRTRLGRSVRGQIMYPLVPVSGPSPLHGSLRRPAAQTTALALEWDQPSERFRTAAEVRTYPPPPAFAGESFLPDLRTIVQDGDLPGWAIHGTPFGGDPVTTDGPFSRHDPRSPCGPCPCACIGVR